MSCLLPTSRCRSTWTGDWWYALHRSQIKRTISSQAEIVLLGDSLTAGLSRYPQAWALFNNHKVTNCGIRGDRIENGLWRVDRMFLPNTVSSAVIAYGINNMNEDTASNIALGVVSIALKLRVHNPQLHVYVAGILPRDQFVTPRREKIRQTNVLLEALCQKNPDISFIEQSSSWTNDSGQLNEKLFLYDFLHLIKAGNMIFASQLASVISKTPDRVTKKKAKRPVEKLVYSRPLPDTCSYRPPVIPSSSSPTVTTPCRPSRHRRKHPRASPSTPSSSPPTPALPPESGITPTSHLPPDSPPTPSTTLPSSPISSFRKKGSGRCSLISIHFLIVFFIFFAFLLGSVGNDVNKGRVEGVFVEKGWKGMGSIFNGTNVFIWDFLGMGAWGRGNSTFYNGRGEKVDWGGGGTEYYSNDIT